MTSPDILPMPIRFTRRFIGSVLVAFCALGGAQANANPEGAEKPFVTSPVGAARLLDLYDDNYKHVRIRKSEISKKAKAAAEARDRDTQARQGWRPEGRMVGHLAEHKMAVNKIVVSPDQRYFATASDDGTVRFWDCARLEGKAVTNESKQQFTKQVRGAFHSLVRS